MMVSVLLIGAGGAGSVFAKKWDKMPSVFDHLHIASRTLSKCVDIQSSCKKNVTVSQLDADDSSAVVSLIQNISPELVVNLALPYQDLTIMDACLATGVHYLDTANYEPPEEAKFCYKWQWDYQDQFEKAGIMALLGSGFDPGVTNVFTAFAAKHEFDEIHTLDILDCNGGDHGHKFATNFNPEINIREITQNGRYYQDGQIVEIPAMSQALEFDFPNIGSRKAYLLYHEELESLAKHFPDIKRLRFWMTFSESYLTHLDVLQNVGMTSIEPIMFNGQEIIPIQFLKELLPDPASLAERYTGLTCIGCLMTGKKDGADKTVFVFNNCDHKKCYEEVGAQAVSYTTGVPALLGAELMLEKIWSGAGVFNIEQLDPDPFMSRLGEYGLGYEVMEMRDGLTD